MFQGDSEIDTIFKVHVEPQTPLTATFLASATCQIFQKLGTPNDISWPGVQDLPKPDAWGGICFQIIFFALRFPQHELHAEFQDRLPPVETQRM